MEMKKINIFKCVWPLILLLFALSACDDVLEQVPSDKISIERILKKNTVEGFRNNSYNHLNDDFTSLFAGQLLEAYTDDAFRAGTVTPFEWHSGQLSPEQNMFASQLWNQYWQGIRKSNLALRYLPQSQAPKDLISDEKLNRWIDEVKVLRAWYHFLLVKNFGSIPFVDEPFSPEFVGWADLTRPTYQEIAMRIVQECDEVIDNGRLSLRWSSSSDYDKISLGVAYALKSRVLLYNASALNNASSDRAKWQMAADAAQECLTALAPEYQLLPVNDYDNLFNEAVNEFNAEMIFRAGPNGAPTMNANNGVDLSYLGSALQSSNCGSVPSQELVDCFELLNGTLPVASYNNTQHTNVTLNSGYSENVGDNPYAGRDARLQHAVVFNGSKYGKYKGQPDGVPELTIYTYEGKPGTGFNGNPTSQDENDKRRSCTGYYGRKFRSARYWGSTVGDAEAHKIYFRLAEIYLNLAEAQCELDNLDQAIAALDVIRTRAMQPGIASVPGFAKTKDFLMKRIRNERRVELCFEGHRFYDQRRWEILDQTNGTISAMKIVSDNGTDVGTFTYQRVEIDAPRAATTDKYLVLPLPSEEARRLTGLGQPEAWK